MSASTSPFQADLGRVFFPIHPAARPPGTHTICIFSAYPAAWSLGSLLATEQMMLRPSLETSWSCSTFAQNRRTHSFRWTR